MFNRKQRLFRKALADSVISVLNISTSGWSTVTDNPALQYATFDIVTSRPLSNPSVRSSVAWMTATLVKTPLVLPNSARITVTYNPAGLIASSINGNIIVTDGLAPLEATTNFTATITDPAPVIYPAIQLSRTTLNLSCYEGTNPGSEIIVASDLNQLALGTLTVVDENAYTWPSFNITSGANNKQNIACLFPSVNTLAPNTYTTRFEVRGTAATNNPQYINVSLTVLPFVPGTYDAPRLATPARGWTYDATFGDFRGSCFNRGLGFVGARNGAMPTKTGVVYLANTLAQYNTNIKPLIANGTIQDGDTIKLEATASFYPLIIPERAGWVEGTSGFIFIEGTLSNLLPTYAYGSAFAYTFADRPTRNSRNNMPKLVSTTTNQPAVFFAKRASGFWFTGINFHYGGLNRSTALVDLHPWIGSSTRDTLNAVADESSHIVFDRCCFTTDGFILYNIGLKNRYCALYHNYFDMAVTNINNDEPKCILWSAGSGQIDILGNKCPGWGMSFLSGGGAPSIPNTNCDDVMFAYNDCAIHDSDKSSINRPGIYLGNDCKNGFEVKSGRYITCAFNYFSGQEWRDDQKFLFVIKCTSQSGANYYSEVDHILIWGNFCPNVGKGLGGANDIYPASLGAVGSKNIEIRHNVHSFNRALYSQADYGIQDGGLLSLNNCLSLAFYSSQGNGIPGLDCSHNTMGGRASMIETDTSAIWTDITHVRLEDNLYMDSPRYGPVRGNLYSNTGALDRMFATNGTYSFRANAIAPPSGPGSIWDATMLAGVFPNRYLQAGGYAANFVDAVNYDFELLPGHPLRTQSTTGGIIGADVPHVRQMTAGVISP